MTEASEIERTLRSGCLPGLEGRLPESFVLPHYEGYSIANVPPTIAAVLGTEIEGSAPPLPRDLWDDLSGGDVRCVVTVLLDAVGYLQLQRLLSEQETLFNRLAEAGRLVPLTSVFPSTTVSALTTLRTGRAPLGHGFLGTRLLLGEQGVLANMLRLAPAAHGRREELKDWGWDPDGFVTAPSLAEALSAADVRSLAYIYLHHLRGSLSRIFLHGMEKKQGYVGFSDLWLHLRRTLIRRQKERLFVWVYWSNIDMLGHVYGPEDEACQAELRNLAHVLESDLLTALPAEAREGTVLMFLADHGQIPSPPERRVALSEHPALRQTLLLPPGGETRAAYLYVRPGQADALRAYVEEHLVDRFVLLETERALSAGLFGPDRVTPTLRSRLGDFLLVARDGSRLVNELGSHPPLGHHGSLTPEEMLVPLLMVRLDELE